MIDSHPKLLPTLYNMYMRTSASIQTSLLCEETVFHHSQITRLMKHRVIALRFIDPAVSGMINHPLCSWCQFFFV